MSNDKKSVDPLKVDTSSLNIENLIELASKPVKNISSSSGSTVVEFEDGELLTLNGGGAQILDYKEPHCSFCNRTRSEVELLAAPPHKNEPLICPDCAVAFVELFAAHGVELKLNISKISPELAKQVSSFTSSMGNPNA